MVVFAILVISLRNAVSSALCLVMTFLCLATLFIILEAFFLGIIQILVYAGAVMVLFLFIIMLLDLKEEAERKINLSALTSSFLVIGAFLYLMAVTVLRTGAASLAQPELQEGRIDDVRSIGEKLFTEFNLPFQVVGALLLVATIGVIVLSKRQLR